MSEYSKLQTKYKDRDCLVKALAEQGYTNVEVHETPQRLVDFQGRQTHYTDKNGDTANIIVRRRDVGGAANDLGFLKQEDGTYAAMVSAYDKSKHNATWFDGLKRHYSEAVTVKEAARQGLRPYKRTVVNGVLTMQYLKV